MATGTSTPTGAGSPQSPIPRLPRNPRRSCFQPLCQGPAKAPPSATRPARHRSAASATASAVPSGCAAPGAARSADPDQRRTAAERRGSHGRTAAGSSRGQEGRPGTGRRRATALLLGRQHVLTHVNVRSGKARYEDSRAQGDARCASAVALALPPPRSSRSRGCPPPGVSPDPPSCSRVSWEGRGTFPFSSHGRALHRRVLRAGSPPAPCPLDPPAAWERPSLPNGQRSEPCGSHMSLRRRSVRARPAETVRVCARALLLMVDEIGDLPANRGGANLVLGSVNPRCQKGALAIGLERVAPRWLTPDLEPRPRRTVTGPRRPRRRNRAARSPAALSRRHPDRGCQPSPPQARRARPAACPRQRPHLAAATEKARPAARRRCGRPCGASSRKPPTGSGGPSRSG